MREFLSYVLLPALAVALALSIALERGIRLIGRAWMRRGARTVCFLGHVFLALLLLPFFAARLDLGTWFCPVCGAIEDRDAFFGVTLATSETPGDEARAARRFSAWLATVGPVAHEHGWIQTGCHRQGGRVSCSERVEVFLFHNTLPLASDAELARGLVVRLARASEAERHDLLRDFQQSEPGDVFDRIAQHERLTREEFDAGFGAWLEQHPSWR
jgi:hypothetical protein